MKRLDETTRRGVLAAGGILAVGGVTAVGVSGLSNDDGQDGAAPATVRSATATTALGLDLAGLPVMGSMDAPVDLYYYTDYQCPFCGRFESETLPELLENEVSDGEVRLVFVSYPYIGPASRTAAIVDRCVWRQVRENDPAAWWDWHTTLFDEQGQPNSGWASRERLFEFAGGVDGVDATAVEDCVAANETEVADAVAADVEQAGEFGVDATPSFVVANRQTERAGRIVGAQPYTRFQDAFERIRDA